MTTGRINQVASSRWHDGSLTHPIAECLLSAAGRDGSFLPLFARCPRTVLLGVACFALNIFALPLPSYRRRPSPSTESNKHRRSLDALLIPLEPKFDSLCDN
jgi:hypothetical protein